MAVFTTPLLSTFGPAADPLSEGGKWFQWGVADGAPVFFPGTWSGVDRCASLGNAVYNPAGFTLGIPAQYGLATWQLLNTTDQEVSIGLNGLFIGGGQGVEVIVRGDNAKNGYVIVANRTVVKIQKWISGSFSTLASVSADPYYSGSSAPDFALGARAIGSTISAWLWPGGLGPYPSPAGWTQIASVVDSTYPNGLIGIGTSTLTPTLQSFYGGSVPNTATKDVWLPPILVPYNKFEAHP